MLLIEQCVIVCSGMRSCSSRERCNVMWLFANVGIGGMRDTIEICDVQKLKQF